MLQEVAFVTSVIVLMEVLSKMRVINSLLSLADGLVRKLEFFARGKSKLTIPVTRISIGSGLTSSDIDDDSYFMNRNWYKN